MDDPTTEAKPSPDSTLTLADIERVAFSLRWERKMLEAEEREALGGWTLRELGIRPKFP